MKRKSEGYYRHPMVANNEILRREYQEKIAVRALERSTLVVLPTGLGKTVVALMVIAERLRLGKGPILMLAPTKPLVEQHRAFMDRHLLDVEVSMLTGEVSPAKRKPVYGSSDILISTPQVIKNDLIAGDLDISTFDTVVFDEAHRAVGDYPYTFIAERFYESNPHGLVLGLTASPGHDVSRIYEVCKDLGIENIEVRVDSDPDVKPYIQDLDMKTVKVEVSRSMRSMISLLERMYMERAGKLQRMGVLRRKSVPSIKEMLAAGGRIRERLSRGGKDSGPFFQAISVQAQAMKVSHALELAETQGAGALYSYLDRMLKETGNPDCSKATRAVVSDPLFRQVLNRAEAARHEAPPKAEALERFVIQKLREDPDSRVIAFTHFRDTATLVFDRMKRYWEKGIRPVRFVGQASREGDKGLSQKEQKEVLEAFKGGEYNLLIATSVAEEGLDIPGADLVIFYEPIPSEIRTIQRRGRTGRHSAGKVIVLVSKETRDIAYSFSARGKELKMERQLLSLRRMLAKMPLPEKKARFKPRRKEESPSTLESFDKEDEKKGAVSIIADQREMPSAVVEELSRRKVLVRSKQVPEGDYLISDRVVVERKTVQDLSDSIVDGRLFKQASALRSRYQRPVLLIEGDDIFNRRRISREALFGALASLSIDFHLPMVFTRDPNETAEYLIALARRESKEKRGPKMPGPVVGDDLRSIQVRVLSGLPGVSTKLAGRLLDRFHSIEAVVKATEEMLCEVEGIGKNKAREIRGVLSGSTGGED